MTQSPTRPLPASERKLTGPEVLALLSPRRSKSPRILERHIQDAVVAFLEIDGWRAFRTELTVQRERGRVVGERGQPDYLFIRYDGFGWAGTLEESGLTETRVLSQVMWVEFKRPNQKPRADQLAWHRAESARGALVLVVDSIDEFRKWYLASGLNRRISA